MLMRNVRLKLAEWKYGSLDQIPNSVLLTICGEIDPTLRRKLDIGILIRELAALTDENPIGWELYANYRRFIKWQLKDEELHRHYLEMLTADESAVRQHLTKLAVDIFRDFSDIKYYVFLDDLNRWKWKHRLSHDTTGVSHSVPMNSSHT